MAEIKSVGLKEYVDVGKVEPKHFIERTVAAPTAAPEGGVLLQVLAVSVDPYMRGRMRNVMGYIVGPFTLDAPVASGGIARVLASNLPTLAVGDLVESLLPWQGVVAIDAAAAPRLVKIENPLDFPPQYFVGALGMPGFTAWHGAYTIGQPKEGETAFISGAAGAVGMLVGQLWKLKGVRVVGSVGSDDKVEYLTKTLGFDAVFNYKKMSIKEGLALHCPKGIDLYFDNVGGETLEAALDIVNKRARIVACGSISQYDDAPEARYGVKNMFQIVTQEVTMTGFIIFSHMYNPEVRVRFFAEMGGLIKDGKVKVVEHVTKGIEHAGEAFCDMMAGLNLGKAVVVL